MTTSRVFPPMMPWFPPTLEILFLDSLSRKKENRFMRESQPLTAAKHGGKVPKKRNLGYINDTTSLLSAVIGLVEVQIREYAGLD